jgi:dienelactone hydrolase
MSKHGPLELSGETAAHRDPPAPLERAVTIAVGRVSLEGNLAIPPRAAGSVVFAHGSGSSRHSPRNRFVASELRKAGVGTLLIDLLTRDEERNEDAGGRLRFDIDLLARRLAGAAEWLAGQPETAALPIGYFGASTGAAAALVAAARQPARVAAVVSRGGRPDLAGNALPAVRAPTLLIVGGDDLPVIEMNREAFDQLRCTKALKVVPGATHLFEEPGTLEQVARLAAEWFGHHLAAIPGTGRNAR